MVDSPGQFNIKIKREVYLAGDDLFRSVVTRALNVLSFLNIREMDNLHRPREEMCFLIGDADFRDVKGLQSLAAEFNKAETPLIHKIIFATAPVTLEQQHLFFAVEVGARYTVHGNAKEEQLRAYLKRVALEAQDVGSITYSEQEFEKAARAADVPKLEGMIEKLSARRETEDVLGLLTRIHQKLNRYPKVETYLKKILALNPQNLWAANALGRHYLYHRKPAEGIEVLEKLSQFHLLNSERNLLLGDAYLNAGQANKAEENFKKGQQLIGDKKDPRFSEGMAKVSILNGDFDAASELLPKSDLSEQVLAFLNMRAIMAIRTKDYERGLKFYSFALNGCKSGDLLRAKLMFNRGIGHIRANQPSEALNCFSESAKLGGDKFSRARGPLEIAKKIVAGEPGHDAADVNKQQTYLQDLDWESLG